MLDRWLGPHAEKAYFLLRFVTGLMFSFHGFQKMVPGVPSEHPRPAFGELHWWGGLIELVGGLLIAFGLFTRLAAFLSSGQMAVAYVFFHWKAKNGGLQFDENFFPAINRGETALLYAFVFLYIACRGPGICSIDRLLAKRRASNPMP